MKIIDTNVQILPLKYLRENTGQIEGVPANPRILRDAKYRALLDSLKKDDLTGVLPLKIYEKELGEYVVLGGNMRLKALRELHDEDWAVSCVKIPNGTPAEVLRKIVVLDNSTFGEWDMDMLSNEWDPEELKNWGVDVPEIETTEELEAQEDDFDEDTDKVETVCKEGDLWQLGDHRLLCGDSTKTEDVQRLMQGEQADHVRCGDNGIFKGCPVTDEQAKLSAIARAIYEQYPTDGKYILADGRLIICQSHAKASDLRQTYPTADINPLGDWTGGPDVDTGATNRKLGSDMADGVTGGGLHGKDLSKADVSVNIYCHLLAQQTGKVVTACCAIGDTSVNGVPYEQIVEEARKYIRSIGGFEKFAEWGLIRPNV